MEPRHDHDREHHPYEQSYRPPPLPRRSIMLPAVLAAGLTVTLGLALLSRAPRGAEEPVAVRQPSGVEPGVEMVAGTAALALPTSVGVSVSPDIVAGCYLSRQAAFFQYDEANRAPGDLRRLDNVARCLEGGALQGRSLRLVGYVGPSASSPAREANSALTPAHEIANYLVESGITPSRLIEVSRGRDLGESQDDGRAIPPHRRVLIELSPLRREATLETMGRRRAPSGRRTKK